MTKTMRHQYVIPEYYPSFSCKGPDCRATCCNGWGISISMKEYFLMLGLPCSVELRRKLDCAFHIADVRDEQHYACVSPRFNGDCPMHCENGYCAIHSECGEDALPLVCRYYPRSPGSEFAYECSCANSCEHVLELLFQLEEPLAFREAELAFELVEVPRSQDQQILLVYKDVRAMIVRVLQDRSHSLSDRLMRIGRMMRTLDEAFERGDIQSVFASCAQMGYEMSAEGVDMRRGIALMYRMAHLFGESSLNIEEYVQLAKLRLGAGCAAELSGDALTRVAQSYDAASAAFERGYPDWERLFEHMLVNHIFFMKFPFADKRESLWEEYVSLCAAYGLVRFLAVSCLGDGEGGVDRLVDVCAAAFRLIDHSSFDWNALVFLHTMGATGPDALKGIVSI